MLEDYRAPVGEEDRTKAGLAVHLVAARTGALPDRMAARGRLDPLSSRARWLAVARHLVPERRKLDSGVARKIRLAPARYNHLLRRGRPPTDMVVQIDGLDGGPGEDVPHLRHVV